MDITEHARMKDVHLSCRVLLHGDDHDEAMGLDHSLMIQIPEGLSSDRGAVVCV